MPDILRFRNRGHSRRHNAVVILPTSSGEFAVVLTNALAAPTHVGTFADSGQAFDCAWGHADHRGLSLFDLSKGAAA